YVADSANAPWGDKPREFVRERGLKIAEFLVGEGVKAIVIGSNTGTAGAAEALRGALSVPVVGIEPGIKPAVAATRTGVVAAVARQLARVLDERDLRADGERSAERFWTSGDTTTSTRVISALLGRAVHVERLPNL